MWMFGFNFFVQRRRACGERSRGASRRYSIMDFLNSWDNRHKYTCQLSAEPRLVHAGKKIAVKYYTSSSSGAFSTIMVV